MSKKSVFYLFSSLLCCASLVDAKTTVQKTELPVEECGLGPRSMRVGIRHIENKGIGYNTGYTTLETFIASTPERWSVMPFLDLRGHVFDDGKWAANGGGGVRTLQGNRMYGVYSYYDFRHTSHKNYNQISFGVETLGTFWDMRLNGYIPFGKAKSSGYDPKFDRFQGNNLFLTRKFEYALAGTNGEVGVYPIRRKNFELYTGAGPYYLKGRLGGGIWGGQARIRGTYKDWFVVEANYSYDNTFKNIVQGQVAFNIPFGPKSRVKQSTHRSCSDTENLYRRMVQPVIKNEIIPVNRKREKSIAIDPATGQPYTFWFVDNTSHSAGTYESPFSTLASAQSASSTGDIIYVFPGDSTTTGMASGITLKDNQKLWGSAIAHALSTTAGSVAIPSLNPNQIFVDSFPVINLALTPVITNSSGNDVITLANNNEVSGFYIQNLTGNGITASSVTDLSITNCIIQGPDSGASNAYGINLSSVAGNALIDSNFIYQGIIGINIDATGIDNATYTISNNDTPSIALVDDGNHGNFLVTSYTNCSNLSTNIYGNDFSVSNLIATMTFDNTTSGLQACTVNIDNNDLDSDSGFSTMSMEFTLNDYANVNLSITNNTLDIPYGTAVTIAQNQNSILNLEMNNNAFDSWYSSVSATLHNSSQLTGSITNNNFLFDALSGIIISANDTSTIPSFSITGNAITGVLQTYGANSDPIAITTSNSATATVDIVSNFLQAGESGIALTTNGSSAMTASVTNNTITHCQLYGLNFATNNTSTGTWTVDGNTLVASGAKFGAATVGSALITSNNSSVTNLGFTNNLAAPIYPVPTSAVGAYQFTNNSATFHLTSYSGNTGVLTETGTISN